MEFNFRHTKRYDSRSRTRSEVKTSTLLNCNFIGLLLIFFVFPTKVIAQDQFIIESEYVSGPDTVWVFTPSEYKEKSKKFPLVYLLHGYSGSYRQWNDIINLDSLANRYGFILVSPDAFYNSWYLNSPQDQNSQYKDFFFKDLFPGLIDRYRVDTANIFITGLSMGGHGALYLFTQKPNLFKSAGSTSGVVNLAGVGNKYELAKYLGGLNQNRKVWKNHSVVGNLGIIAASNKKFIFDCGREDSFYKMNINLLDKVESMGIDATFISQSGGHNYGYWKKSLPLHLLFFKQQVK